MTFPYCVLITVSIKKLMKSNESTQDINSLKSCEDGATIKEKLKVVLLRFAITLLEFKTE